LSARRWSTTIATGTARYFALTACTGISAITHASGIVVATLTISTGRDIIGSSVVASSTLARASRTLGGACSARSSDFGARFMCFPVGAGLATGKCKSTDCK